MQDRNILTPSSILNLPDRLSFASGCDSQQSMQKAPKKTWTLEEDEAIKELVKKYGPKNWTWIAKFIPHRMGKQCRERWFNHLDPSINKSEWSRD